MVEANNKGFSKVCYYELLDVDRKAEKKVIEKVSRQAKCLSLLLDPLYEISTKINPIISTTLSPFMLLTHISPF